MKEIAALTDTQLQSAYTRLYAARRRVQEALGVAAMEAEP